MKTSEHIAKHLREVYFGGTWTAASVKEKLSGVTWEMATTEAGSLHTIARLVFHINYYIRTAIAVLSDEPTHSADSVSFDCPPISSSEAWERLLDQTWREVEELAGQIERLPDSALNDWFVDEESGTMYRCLHGRIEHAYYHLGQISMLKSLLEDKKQLSDDVP